MPDAQNAPECTPGGRLFDTIVCRKAASGRLSVFSVRAAAEILQIDGRVENLPPV